MSSIDSFFAHIKLPSMSEVSHALIRSMNDAEITVHEVRNILARDAALTAKLLRLANSASFGLPRGVGTLDEAISMVGMSQVRALALGACLNDSFPVIQGLDRAAFWRANMACAGYAQWLAAHLEIDTQMAWLTGMMMRLGELLIIQTEPRVLQDIEKGPAAPGERWSRERKLVGFTEGQITAELARRWNFPMQIVQALQRCAEPMTDQAFSRLGAVVHLAGLLADIPGATVDDLKVLPQEVLDALEIDGTWLSNNFPAADTFLDISGG